MATYLQVSQQPEHVNYHWAQVQLEKYECYYAQLALFHMIYLNSLQLQFFINHSKC